MPSTVLSMWTLYDRPRDYPQHYVARRFEVASGHIYPRPTNDMFTADSLEELRMLLPPGLVCLGRNPSDDPNIVETWI